MMREVQKWRQSEEDEEREGGEEDEGQVMWRSEWEREGEGDVGGGV